MLAELDMMPDLIDSSTLHFALSHTALTRASCCYELALYNKRFLEPKPETGPPPAPLLGSLLAPMPLGYRGWGDAEASVAQDKIFLQEQLNDLYPGGTRGCSHEWTCGSCVSVAAINRLTFRRRAA